MYHRIAESGSGDIYTLSPKLLIRHLEIIKESRVDVLDPCDLQEMTRRDVRGAVLTFDDGTTDHFEVVRPILKRFDVRALFYIPTAKIGKSGHLSEEQVRCLCAEGQAVGSHGHSHRRLDALRSEALRSELEVSSELLRKITGKRPVHFAPPGGYYNSHVMREAERVGFGVVRTMRWGYNRIWDPMRVEAIPMIPVMSEELVKMTVRGKAEGFLKAVYTLKNAARVLWPWGYEKLKKTGK